MLADGDATGNPPLTCLACGLFPEDIDLEKQEPAAAEVDDTLRLLSQYELAVLPNLRVAVCRPCETGVEGSERLIWPFSHTRQLIKATQRILSGISVRNTVSNCLQLTGWCFTKQPIACTFRR